MSKKTVYYSGSDTKRGRDLAESLGVAYIPSSGFTASTYKLFFNKIIPFCKIILKDIILILDHKPDCIIYEHGGGRLQSFVVCCYTKIFGCKLIVDCHTGVYQQTTISDKSTIRRFTSYFPKKVIGLAQIFIAHNEETLELKNLHDNMVVIESKVPVIKHASLTEKPHDNKIKIVFITRFHSDEPIIEMINSTKLFSKKYQFYFTGNYTNKFDVSLAQECENVTFTGFIPDEEYQNLLYRSDVVVVLTTRDYTLLYGGREAIAFNKPLVISNNKTCMNYFSIGAIFVENDATSIKHGILTAIEKREELINEIKILEKEKRVLWGRRLDLFNRKVKDVLN